MQLVNLRLMSHPMNWAFVWIVFLLGAMAWGHIHDAWTANTSISPD